jgi:phospholipid:diacylglycerol acyltransferase
VTGYCRIPQQATKYVSVDMIISGTYILLQRMIASNYSYGLERDEKRLKANNHDSTKWTNPLEIQYVNS